MMPADAPPGHTCASHDAMLGGPFADSVINPASTNRVRKFTAVCVAMNP